MGSCIYLAPVRSSPPPFLLSSWSQGTPLLPVDLMNAYAVVPKVWSLDQQAQSPWELVRDADSQSHPRPAESEALGVGPDHVGFIKPPGDSEACSGERTPQPMSMLPP